MSTRLESKNFKIVNFDKKYAKEICELESAQWGDWDDEGCIEEVKEDEIILIALNEDNFVGMISGKLEQDVFHLLICCIKPEFQKMGLGTILLKEIMKKASKKFKLAKFRAEAISVYGKCNAKRVLEKEGFQLVRIDEKYWGNLYPHVVCKECLKSPCECDSFVFELENKI